MIKLGMKIDTPELWNELPIGATVTDRDGWIHTKVRDYSPGTSTSTWVDPETDQKGTFNTPWAWGTVLTSLPEPELAPHPEIGTVLAWNSQDAGLFGVKNGDRVTVTGHAGRNLSDVPLITIRPTPPRLARRSAPWSMEHFAPVDELDQRELEALRGDVATLKDALTEAQVDLAATKDAAREYREQADAEVTRLLALLDTRADELAEVEKDSAAAHAALSYVLEHLPSYSEGAALKTRTLGYWDGVKDAQS